MHTHTHTRDVPLRLTLRLLAGAAPSYGYLEACMRFFPDQQTEPLFLSSGAEDYFLSAYYFNEGQFKTPNSGLTYYDGKGTLSAYKTHDRDPLFFNDGLKMVFRNNEDTTGCGDSNHCPNQYCRPGAAPDTAVPLLGARGGKDAARAPDVNADYNTLVWVYEWPATAPTENVSPPPHPTHPPTHPLSRSHSLDRSIARSPSPRVRTH